ncbi:MAG: phage integrase N-terminal SAM-like domain-containing protein, partial [Anaerolineales bacterium]|nr:phage integrase N-terminal SAM-like domain-containing protein [Anaerolineales bacterium]
MSHLSLNPRSDQLIQDAYDDFILSREAKLLSPKTIKWYEQTAGRFVEWLQDHDVQDPAHVRAKHVREFLAHHKGRGLADATVHGMARGAKALLRFFEQEGYINAVAEWENEVKTL